MERDHIGGGDQIVMSEEILGKYIQKTGTIKTLFFV